MVEVAELRQKLGISQAVLAVRLGVNQSKMSRMEAGTSPISKRLQKKMDRLAVDDAGAVDYCHGVSGEYILNGGTFRENPHAYLTACRQLGIDEKELKGLDTALPCPWCSGGAHYGKACEEEELK